MKIGKVLLGALTFYLTNREEIDPKVKKVAKKLKGKKKAQPLSGPGLPPIGK